MASPTHSSAVGMISETTDPGVASRPALEVLYGFCRGSADFEVGLGVTVPPAHSVDT